MRTVLAERGFAVEFRSKAKQPRIYLHSAERMPEVADQSAKLFLGASVFLGKGVPWSEYRKLYEQVYLKQALRVIRGDGYFLVIQTNAYQDGGVLCRYQLLLDLLLPAGWKLIDEKVWVRKKADFFQIPFSHVLAFIPPNGTGSRTVLNKHKDWFPGAWVYGQTKGSGCASYPYALSRLLVEACTDKGDLIVDAFSGSGIVSKTAAELGRESIGYEIDEEMIPVLDSNGCKVIR